MIPAKFDYHKASTLEEAISLLDEHGYDAKLLSGGHSLLPAMKLRLNRPEVLIDISGISGLNSIKEEGNEIVVGANCTHQTIATSGIVQKDLNILAQAAGMIGDLQVRNRGTLGGSLAHADPASDYPATVLATDASIEVAGPDGTRSIAATDFFQGIFTTALDDKEIITAIRFPKAAKGAYLKFFQSASRFAVVGCAVVMDGDKIKVGVTGVSDVPYRATAVENAYSGDAAAAATHATEGIDVMGDHFASEEYRAHLAKVFVERAIKAASVFGRQDDLTKIEGIGPKIAELLHADGIKSYEDLANTTPEHIKGILNAAGSSFSTHNPGTWPRQSRLAADGEWEALKKWQDELDGGV